MRVLMTAFILLMSATNTSAQSLRSLVEWGASSMDAPVRTWGTRFGARTDDLQYQGVRVSEIDMRQLGAGAQLLRETALSVGAKGGMAHRFKQLEATIHSVEPLLDRAFPFDSVVMRNGSIMPPVLSTASDHIAISDDNTVFRAAGQSFHIIKQARFITVTPTWRDYLLHTAYSVPKKPENALLPKSKVEYNAWRTWVIEGWEQGMRNADEVWRINIAKLRRDLVGMYLYHILRVRGMVSEPFVEAQMQAVSGDEENLIINDRTLQITVMPKMQHNTEHWRALESLPDLFGVGID